MCKLDIFSAIDNDYKTKDCDNIVGYGIKQQELRNYIESVTWYLKGSSASPYNKQNFYTCERSDTTTIEKCSSGNNGEYVNKVENRKIGLIYQSDYMYASGYYGSSDKTSSGRQNWIYKGPEWTITPNPTSDTYVINTGDGSSYSHAHSYFPKAIRPTFYLKSSIKIRSGDGTYNNPFIIG